MRSPKAISRAAIAGFQPWVIMVLPPGGFFVLGSWLLFFSWLERRKQRRLAAEVVQHA